MKTSTRKPAAVKTTVTRFDSACPAFRFDCFGIGIILATAEEIAESVAEMTSPAIEVEMTDAEWDMQAEESMMRDAIESGWAGHSLDPVAPVVKPAAPKRRPESFTEGFARIAEERRPAGAPADTDIWNDFYRMLEKIEADGCFA